MHTNATSTSCVLNYTQQQNQIARNSTRYEWIPTKLLSGQEKNLGMVTIHYNDDNSQPNLLGII